MEGGGFSPALVSFTVSQAFVMRRTRPAFQAILAQARRATAVAGLFSLAAAILALALPLLVMHAVEAAERRTSIDALLLVAAAALAAGIIRTVLLVARDRMLLEAALWMQHTAGRAILMDRLDRGVMPETLEADRRALDLCVRALAGPAVSACLDAIVAIVPLVLLFVLHPALGAVSLVAMVAVVASGLRRARRSAGAVIEAAATQAVADQAWRLAAANGPVIAARNMAAGVVADWDVQSRAAVSAAYLVAKSGRVTSWLVGATEIVSSIAVVIVGAWLVQSDHLGLAGLAAGVVLHVLLIRAALGAHATVSDLAAAESALQHLSIEPRAMASAARPASTIERQRPPAAVPPARPPANYGMRSAQPRRGG